MQNILNTIKDQRRLVFGAVFLLLIGIVVGTSIGGGSIGGLKSSYLGDDSVTCTRTCPDGSTIDANSSCPDNQQCTNGASNYPDCNNNTGYCGDGTCNNGEDQMSCSSDCGSSNTCTNGASNYPDCNNNTGYCGDGTCNNGEDQMSCSSDCGSSNTCTNGASNYPDCNDNNQCTNGASNYPTCDDNIIPGCTDPKASNYNPNANVSDDSCEFYNCKNEEEQAQWNRDNIKTYQNNINRLRQEQEANKNSWSTTIFGDDTEERIQEEERKIKINEEELKQLESELETCRKEGINSNRQW